MESKTESMPPPPEGGPTELGPEEPTIRPPSLPVDTRPVPAERPMLPPTLGFEPFHHQPAGPIYGFQPYLVADMNGGFTAQFAGLSHPAFDMRRPPMLSPSDTRVPGRYVQFTPTMERGRRRSANDGDNHSVSSSEPDPSGWTTFAVASPDVKTVYEAWEMVTFENTLRPRRWKRFLGINFGQVWESMRDGSLHLAPLAAFGQDELAERVAGAVKSFEAKKGKGGKKCYDQDLANRAYKLPDDAYNMLQRLLDRKDFATNKNPHRQRQWRLVMMEEHSLDVTEMAPQRRRRGPFRRKERPPVERWLIVIRGEQSRYSREGWAGHDRYTNPWRRVDRQDLRARRHEKDGDEARSG